MIETLITILKIISKDNYKKILLFGTLLLVATLMESFGIILFFQSFTIFFSDNFSSEQNIFSFILNRFPNLNLNDFKFFTLVFLVAIMFIKTIYLTIFSYWKNNFLYNNLYKKLSLRLFNNYLNYDYEKYLSNETSGYIRNLSIDLLKFIASAKVALALINEIIIIIFILLVLLYLNFTIAISSIIFFSIALILFYLFFFKRLEQRGEIIQEMEGSLIKFLNESFTGIEQIKVMNIENYFEERILKNISTSSRARTFKSWMEEMPKVWIEFSIIFSGIAILLFLTFYKNINIYNIIPILITFAVAITRILPSFNKTVEYINVLGFYKKIISTLGNDLSDIKIDYPKKKLALTDKTLLKNIKFDNLNYSFSKSKILIKNFNYEINFGEHIGLIGESGTGKSTLVRILLGLLKLSSGKILINGQDLNNIDKKIWLKNIGYVSQNTFLINGSIRENIALGSNIKNISEENLKNSIKLSEINKFVDSLDLKENHKINWTGSNISNGQRQRIGLARALYRKPSLLILDEYTSALDNETEDQIINTIGSLKNKVTCIIISHSKKVIQKCDKIIDTKYFKDGI